MTSNRRSAIGNGCRMVCGRGGVRVRLLTAGGRGVSCDSVAGVFLTTMWLGHLNPVGAGLRQGGETRIECGQH